MSTRHFLFFDGTLNLVCKANLKIIIGSSTLSVFPYEANFCVFLCSCDVSITDQAGLTSRELIPSTQQQPSFLFSISTSPSSSHSRKSPTSPIHHRL
ncbi:hypothetical protein CEXT_470851 [Caerostris extrusa]|uniref:Uncharacterized protein n=1 Tax=Caerostris extrusa TaxID=172846 RepID=A0AAV4R0G8_CAEEX|nr:hypothetical protein CEXT_470851 [Caerostris extrusa]